MEKSIEESSKEFLEYSGLKIYDYLKKSEYGKLINLATEYDIKNGIYSGKISFELSIINCHNIETIIKDISKIIFADFEAMKPLDFCNMNNYTPTGNEGYSYLFIFGRYVR